MCSLGLPGSLLQRFCPNRSNENFSSNDQRLPDYHNCRNCLVNVIGIRWEYEQEITTFSVCRGAIEPRSILCVLYL